MKSFSLSASVLASPPHSTGVLETFWRRRQVAAILSPLSKEHFQSEVTMDFDPRWRDDPRDRDDYGLRAEALAKAGRELSQGSRGGLSNLREREPLDARDVFTRDLELPRGPERERVWARDSDVRLRGSEVRTLATVGAFRVVPAGDLRDGQDRPLDPHRGDLRHLRDSGLVETIPGHRQRPRAGRAHRTRPGRPRAQPLVERAPRRTEVGGRGAGVRQPARR